MPESRGEGVATLMLLKCEEEDGRGMPPLQPQCIIEQKAKEIFTPKESTVFNRSTEYKTTPH